MLTVIVIVSYNNNKMNSGPLTNKHGISVYG